MEGVDTMKVALICPANILYMPYVKNYEEILKRYNINYDIINWDRNKIEEKKDHTYTDNKIGNRRNIYDYYKFYKYIKKN